MTTTRRWPLVAALVIGLLLAAAPVAFQMFSRAPRGGDMIDGFKPYMNVERIDRFRTDLSTIDAAHAQAIAVVAPSPAVQRFLTEWPAIDDDMRSMLTTMEHNIGNYRGVAALPPFVLFPWFFVIPGLAVAVIAGFALRAERKHRSGRGLRIALVAAGIGLIAAPAVFQMFTRAPGGASMIDDFKPFMTETKVTRIQGYFLTIGTAEGDLRRVVVPGLQATGTPADQLDAIVSLNEQWPTISAGMAPMIGAMADNVGNFGAVAALPPFGLFPWFFVVPGVLVIGLALGANRRSTATDPATEEQPALHLQGAPS